MTDELDYQVLDTLIARFLSINERIQGNAKQRFLIKYRGKLIDADSAKSYDQLSGELAQYKLVPRFFVEDDRHVISLERALPQPKPSNPRINLILFILTLLSVLVTGGLMSIESDLPPDPLQAILLLISHGWPFAIAMLSILGVHELGHYFAGRRRGTQVTLPYFIPLPFSAFGTLGAFINMRSQPKNRIALFDLAITGPLCGLIVSLIVLTIGLNLSTLSPLPLAPSSTVTLQLEGNSLIYVALKFLTFGKLLPQPIHLNGLSLMIFWLQYFFTGRPFPWGSLDVMLHPVAWAGWAGLFVTAMNLIPAGQLDGGHIFASAFGIKNARRLLPFVLAALVIMGFFWATWWIWAALIYLMSRFYAEPMDQITPLDNKRKWLAWLAILILILTFIPVPLTIVGA